MEHTDHSCQQCAHCCSKKMSGCGGCTGGIYGLALVGAAIYYIQNATTFWTGVVGILKAIIWPAMLVYNLLGFLKM